MSGDVDQTAGPRMVKHTSGAGDIQGDKQHGHSVGQTSRTNTGQDEVSTCFYFDIKHWQLRSRPTPWESRLSDGPGGERGNYHMQRQQHRLENLVCSKRRSALLRNGNLSHFSETGICRTAQKRESVALLRKGNLSHCSETGICRNAQKGQYVTLLRKGNLSHCSERGICRTAQKTGICRTAQKGGICRRESV
ncbi:hypothetical protein RRG08_011894 [Elysia crispata]|uniref:Uncharacterized protein n=1 Tax=Elysia crispata TaxID=231223 RepID=A0AAE0ZN96_9GAST|nr:hypothetical protein RRG08_011894 [Elysia crispata]